MASFPNHFSSSINIEICLLVERVATFQSTLCIVMLIKIILQVGRSFVEFNVLLTVHHSISV
jgi:hypothetical protein